MSNFNLKIKDNNQNYLLILIYTFIAFSILSFYKDFGIHIEEKFHRLNGLYWLNYIAKIFNLENLLTVTSLKIQSITDYTLSPIEKYNKYGIILDLPIALIDVLINTKHIKLLYEIKHLVGFYIFLASSFCFFLILKKRFKYFFISLTGALIYLTTPRIFGDSFLYKDVLFLSFFTITILFFIKFETEKEINYKTLVFFSLFSALSFNLRIFAIFFPITFLFIIIFNSFYDKNFFKRFKYYLTYIILFIIFVFIFSPYLWVSPINNFFDIFYSIKKDLIGENIKILFNSEYIFNRYTPENYLIVWIAISTPLLILFFFILGFIFYTKRFLKRVINIKENYNYNDLWRGKAEKIDFIMFFIFISIFFSLLILNSPFYNGWRLVYFFNIFFIYFFIYKINYLTIVFNKKIINKTVNILLLLSLLSNLINLKFFHPFQSLYFNKIAGKNIYKKYEIDYYGLSGKNFFLYVNKIDNSDIIKVAVASHTPLHRSIEALENRLQKKFIVVGQEYLDADYIYKNNISEVNPNFNKKYNIPKNFDKIYEYKIQNILIYEVYKKIK